MDYIDADIVPYPLRQVRNACKKVAGGTWVVPCLEDNELITLHTPFGPKIGGTVQEINKSIHPQL